MKRLKRISANENNLMYINREERDVKKRYCKKGFESIYLEYILFIKLLHQCLKGFLL